MGNMKAKSAEKNTLQHYNRPPDQFTLHTHTHTAENLQEAAPSGHGTAVLDTTS